MLHQKKKENNQKSQFFSFNPRQRSFNSLWTFLSSFYFVRRSALLILYYLCVARGVRDRTCVRDVFINVVSDITRLGGFFRFHAAARTAAAAAVGNKRKNPEGNLLVTRYQISRRRDGVIDLICTLPTRRVISFHFLRIWNAVWRKLAYAPMYTNAHISFCYLNPSPLNCVWKSICLAGLGTLSHASRTVITQYLWCGIKPKCDWLSGYE